MLFMKEEKVFSLFKSTTIPQNDIKALFEELYCYLLIAGLYREGEGVLGLHASMDAISNQNFNIPSGSYTSSISPILTKGIKDRFTALLRHPWLSDTERGTLQSLDGIFTRDPARYHSLTGNALLGIAIARDFGTDMLVIARYVAVMFGQSNYPVAKWVPRLYLSAFGNIHLVQKKPLDGSPAEGEYHTNDLVYLDAPVLRYGSISSEGDDVTALWALLSAQIESLSQAEYAGELLGDTLASMMFLGQYEEFEKSVPAPRYAASLYMQRRIGMDKSNTIPFSNGFYKNFLYGSTEVCEVSHKSLLEVIINVMMEKMGETHLDHLFLSNSYYRKLGNSSIRYTKTYTRPSVLQFALESLADLKDDILGDQKKPSKSSKGKSEDVTQDLDTDLPEQSDGLDQGEELVIPKEDDPFGDPQTDDGGYDPSTPPPMQPKLDKNTIDLLSFDKTGEGVNDDLYRTAVVALNDRLRSDDTLPISAEVRDSLNYWVNTFLYRTAIAETKNQITFLHLQQHLKNIPTKG